MSKKIFFPLLLLIVVVSCQGSLNDDKLPIIGRFEMVGNDTVFHEIPDFEFINQDSQVVTNALLDSSIYVADFFFVNCPTICPKVKKQMLRIYDKYENNPKIKLVSHTIDPKRDTPEILKRYASNLEVNTDKWIFLTGDKDALYDIADEYFVVAIEDPDAPEGFDHSGKILLVDTERHIRSFGEGTDPEDIDRFLKDIDKLLAEYAKK